MVAASCRVDDFHFSEETRKQVGVGGKLDGGTWEKPSRLSHVLDRPSQSPNAALFFFLKLTAIILENISSQMLNPG